MDVGAVEDFFRICSYEQVAASAKEFSPDLVVSLLDPGVPPPDIAPPPMGHVKLFFHDDFMRRLNRIRFSEEMAADLMSFRHLAFRKRILVHCMAGISRSPAVALAWIGCGAARLSPLQCVDALARLQPRAQPNRRVLRMMEALSGRGSSLSDALRTHRVLGWQPT